MKKLIITVNGKQYNVDVEVIEDNDVTTMMSPMSYESHPMDAHIPASHHGSAGTPKSKARPLNADDSHTLASPLNGTVLEIHTAPGKTVKENEVVIVLEAMKMKTNISSPYIGVVKSVDVSVGESIETGQTLLTFE